MTYGYTLTQEDIKKLGLIPTGAKSYYVEQSSWTGIFKSLTEEIKNKYGSFKGQVIALNLSEEQQDYIIKNCRCNEY